MLYFDTATMFVALFCDSVTAFGPASGGGSASGGGGIASGALTGFAYRLEWLYGVYIFRPSTGMALDTAFADAMMGVATRFPADDDIAAYHRLFPREPGELALPVPQLLDVRHLRGDVDELGHVLQLEVG